MTKKIDRKELDEQSELIEHYITKRNNLAEEASSKLYEQLIEILDKQSADRYAEIISRIVERTVLEQYDQTHPEPFPGAPPAILEVQAKIITLDIDALRKQLRK